MRAPGYNFPLFLVYPVDMPGVYVCVMAVAGSEDAVLTLSRPH